MDNLEKLCKPLLLGVAAMNLISCAQEKKKPNVVFIIADDLGYGDLSCMGQERFDTPNIDRLASEGMLFTQHYSGSSVSAPSRSSLLTGLHTGHTPIRGNKEYGAEGQEPLPEGTYSVFDVFKSQGFVTGVFGKWGLGYPGSEGVPEKHGVDDFYGYNCQRLAHSYYPYHLWDNDKKVMLPANKGKGEGSYSPYLTHDRAIDFLRKNKDNNFFLMYTTVIPHAELKLPEEEMVSYKGIMEESGPYKGCDDGPGYKAAGYGSQEYPHAAFASMVTLLDRQVGDIVRVLDSLGLSDNTIVIFTSDNGPHREGGADPDFFNSNGPLRGYKRDLYEGGIRVPFIAKWPGHIEAGSQSSHISAFWDFMPTMADAIGAGIDGEIDGISFWPSLTGNGNQENHEYLYWEFHESGGRQAVRKGDWKAVRNNIADGGQIELYNLGNDLGETADVASQYPDMAAEMETIMENSRTASDIFVFPTDTLSR